MHKENHTNSPPVPAESSGSSQPGGPAGTPLITVFCGVFVHSYSNGVWTRYGDPGQVQEMLLSLGYVHHKDEDGKAVDGRTVQFWRKPQ